MASKLLNVLKSIESGRQDCINIMKEKNISIQDDSSFKDIANTLREIEPYNNVKSTIPYYYDNPEDDPMVYKKPTDWPDIETILKSQTEDLIQTDYYNVPIRIALLKNTPTTTTFSMTTTSNITATDDIVYVGRQTADTDIAHCNGVTVITSDGAEYNIGKYYGVDSIQHTWDSTKDIDNKYRWFIIKHIMHAYTSGNPPTQGYIVGLNAITMPLLAVIDAPGFCKSEAPYNLYGRFDNSLSFIKTISPFTPVHIAIANAVATYRHNNPTTATWGKIPLMCYNASNSSGLKRCECNVNINKDQYFIYNNGSLNLEVFICNAELPSFNQSSIGIYRGSLNLVYAKIALDPKSSTGLSDLFEERQDWGNRPYHPLRYFEISNLDQYIEAQKCLRCKGLVGIADLKPEHKQKLLDHLDLSQGSTYGNYFSKTFIHEKQVSINLYTETIPKSTSGPYYFNSCDIEHLTIHNLRTVDNSIFTNNTIRAITLPDCVTFNSTVSDNVFYIDLPNCTTLISNALSTGKNRFRTINIPKIRITDSSFFTRNSMLEEVVVKSIYCNVDLYKHACLKPQALVNIFSELETLSSNEGYTLTVPPHLHNFVTQEEVQSAEAKGWKVVY